MKKKQYFKNMTEVGKYLKKIGTPLTASEKKKMKYKRGGVMLIR